MAEKKAVDRVYGSRKSNLVKSIEALRELSEALERGRHDGADHDSLILTVVSALYDITCLQGCFYRRRACAESLGCAADDLVRRYRRLRRRLGPRRAFEAVAEIAHEAAVAAVGQMIDDYEPDGSEA